MESAAAVTMLPERHSADLAASQHNANLDVKVRERNAGAQLAGFSCGVMQPLACSASTELSAPRRVLQGVEVRCPPTVRTSSVRTQSTPCTNQRHAAACQTACLQQAHPVLHGGPRQLHPVEDGAEDDGSRHVGHAPRNDGGTVPRHLAPGPPEQQLHLHGTGGHGQRYRSLGRHMHEKGVCTRTAGRQVLCVLGVQNRSCTCRDAVCPAAGQV